MQNSSSKVANKDANDVAETMEAIPKSAFELLKGMINHAHRTEASTVSPSLVNPVTTSVATEPQNKRNNSSILVRRISKSDQHSSKKALKIHSSEIAQDQSLVLSSSCSLASLSTPTPAVSSMPSSLSKYTGPKSNSSQSSSILQLNTASRLLGSSHVSNAPELSSNLPSYSCVVVPANSSNPQNKVILISNFGASNSLSKSATSNSTHVSSSTGSQVLGGEGNQVFQYDSRVRQSSSGVAAVHDRTSSLINARMSDLITRTVNKFYVEGPQLKKCNDILGINQQCGKEPPDHSLQCATCRENFFSEESFKFHLERPIFCLKYACSHCKETKVFINKCALWEHLRSVSDHESLNYDDIKSFEPFEFANNGNAPSETSHSSLPNPSQKTNSREACGTHTGETSVPQSLTCQNLSSDTINPASGEPGVVRAGSNVSQTRCSNCKRSVSDLTYHLFDPKQGKYHCLRCDMILPSECAWQAHCKIHVQSANIKKLSCPECGKHEFKWADGTEDLRAVFDHLDSCQHFNRTVFLTCDCGQKFVTFKDIVKHFTNCHLKTLFKCPHCVLAFTRTEHFIGHCEKIHKIQGSAVSPTVLCTPCQQILKCQSDAKEHVDDHFGKFISKAVFGWRCFICCRVFTQKQTLQHHAEVEHPHKSKRCTICFRLFRTRKNLVEHIVLKRCSRTLPKCFSICFDDLSSEEEESGVEISKVLTNTFAAPPQSKSVRAAKTVEVPLPVPSGSTAMKRQLSQKATANKQQQLSHQQRQIVSRITGQLSSLSAHEKDPENILFYQCHPCKIVITGKRNHQEHMRSHAREGNMSVDIARCVVCKKFIKNSELTSHLKIHVSQGAIICFRCQRRDFRTVRDAIIHADAYCDYKFVEGPGIVNDSDHSTVRDLESGSALSDLCGRIEGSSDHSEERNTPNMAEAFVENGDHQTQPNVFPCLLCGLAFQCLQTRDEHVSRQHEGTRIVYHCLLCQKKNKPRIFTSKKIALRHICKKHRIVNVAEVEKQIRTEEQNVSSGQRLPFTRKVPMVSESISPPKRLRIAAAGDFMCGKCGFSCSGSEEFSKHISSHSSSTEPQCPECGLSFTVLPALKKHLFAVHKIKAVENYLQEKNIKEPEIVEDEMDLVPEIHPLPTPLAAFQDTRGKPTLPAKSSSVNPFECTVCYKIFDAEVALKTHMRNHGMAFIRSKRYKQ